MNTRLLDAENRGMEQGIEKGEKNKSIEIAKNLLSMNMSINDIMKATNLTEDEILALKK